MGRYKKHQIFIKFLVSYILIMLIPLLIGMFAYNETLKIVVSDAQEANLSSLEEIRYGLDRRMAEIDAMVKFLAVSSKTSDVLDIKDPYESGAIAKINNLKEYISIYGATNTFINTIYIHFKEGDIIMTPYTTNINGHIFFNSFFNYGDSSISEWYDQVLNTYHFNEYLPVIPVTINGQNHSSLIYLQSIPLNNFSEIKGTVMVLINTEKMDEMLKPLRIGDGGWAYIADANGKPITQISSSSDSFEAAEINFQESKGFIESTINGEKMMITYTTSLYNKWKYVAVLPYDTAMERVEYIKRIIWQLLLLSVLIGLGVAYFMAYRSSKPIRDLLLITKKRFEGENKKDDSSYDFLNTSIRKIIDDNMDLEDKMAKQMPYLKTTFFLQLLNGGFSRMEEIEVFNQYTGLHSMEIKDKKIMVALIQINGYEHQLDNENLYELNIEKAVLRDFLKEKIGEKGYLIDIDFDKIALLLLFDKGAEHGYRQYVEQVAAETSKNLLDHYKIRMVFACGRLGENFLEAGRAFDEAKQALFHYVMEKGKPIIWHDQIEKIGRGYYYSLDMELRLINLVKSGEQEGIEKLVNEIFQENYRNRNISKDMSRYLILDMRGTMFKLIDFIKDDDEKVFEKISGMIHNLRVHTSNEDVFKGVEQIFNVLCDEIKTYKKELDSNLKEEIVKFVEANYKNSQLSLLGVAHEFARTESYITQLFKKQYNSTFSDFVENMRVEKACELLTQTEITIEEMTEYLGYNSSHSFRRAFKRVRNINPAAYRELGG
jgi:two-component system response regulator YesN